MEKAEENLELISKYFGNLDPRQLEQLAALGDLYHDWNSKINVVSRKDEAMLYRNHVLHSLVIAAAFDLKKGMNVLDIGTGGGFPGIPLAIFFPEARFYLADSIGKKIKVVEAVVEAIGLKNVTAHHTRAEDIKGTKFDTIVSRAVAPLKDLWKWSRPLLAPIARFATDRSEDQPVPHGLICLKGGDLAQEIAESGCHPTITEVSSIFGEPYFEQKYILYLPVA